jgi:group I intron endonuclease
MVLSREEARKLVVEREQYYMDSLEPEYNILKVAGSSLGFKHTDESLALMSEATKVENHPLYGKTHTVESLVKIGIIKTGEINPRYGKTHSAETRALMSEALKGVFKTKQHKIEISLANSLKKKSICLFF